MAVDKVIEMSPEHGYYPFQIRLNDGSIFQLRTNKLDERTTWVKEISKAILPKTSSFLSKE